MRSNEVAKLAGVSVRTLRHYHSLGLLPEPERSANGYRDYTTDDVVRVLRIKRLSSLGFPLSCIGEMLDDRLPDRLVLEGGGDDAMLSALDALDAELELQMERLAEQRRAELVAEALGVLEPLSECFKPENWLRPMNEGEELLDRMAVEGMNGAQRDVYDRIWTALDAKVAVRAGEGSGDAAD